ncbi:TetR/AcrR family transcriptional regulator [Kineobactrum sediminis]|uniref:TetR/AcrR family transcriptional regulator n=1 Tax=Kineobactrum sediminis TaxID=1905677 RepID=UPI00139060B3|nr:TetR/AcrR family transcriptional regulator [Kineobactrum sediminis]
MEAKRQAVRKKPVRRGEARDRLLAAARDKIIEQGLEGVSIRAINAAAGVSPGILHYHFGSLEELVLELLGRFMDPMMREREDLLRALKAGGHSPTIREIAEILVMPVARLALEHGEDGYGHVCLLARLYADRAPLLEEANMRWASRFNSALFEQLQLANPELHDPEIALRLDLAGQVLLRGLSALHQPPVPWLEQRGVAAVEPWQQVHVVVDFVAAGLGAAQAQPTGFHKPLSRF